MTEKSPCPPAKYLFWAAQFTAYPLDRTTPMPRNVNPPAWLTSAPITSRSCMALAACDTVSSLNPFASKEPNPDEIAVPEAEVVLIPKPLFLRLMDQDASFRAFVLQAFGTRMADLTRVLEQVAFGRVEVRLAALLLDRAEGTRVSATQADLAARIGTAREVVTRKLDAFAREGWISTERGQVILLDPQALRRLTQGL